MEMMGMCAVCGTPGVMFTCRICGRMVCATHFNPATGTCVECGGRMV
ncbi:MAG: orotate phosphoribosyltransferase [Thermoplasmata archaeon]|nr:orotate phosphoribosyltransferase [Thermoplasmata archaeon]